MVNLYTVIIFFIIYLICSINPAIEICKKKTGEDIRKLGSGNAGSANAMRVLGRLLGMAVVVFDVLKVFAAFGVASIVSKFFGHSSDELLFINIFILASIIGHCFPVYYKFRGGKGVIVGITVIAILDPRNALICIIAGLVILLFTKTASKAALSGLVLYIIISLVMGYEYLVCVLIASAIVMFKHRQSIYRILTKQESNI